MARRTSVSTRSLVDLFDLGGGGDCAWEIELASCVRDTLSFFVPEDDIAVVVVSEDESSVQIGGWNVRKVGKGHGRSAECQEEAEKNKKK